MLPRQKNPVKCRSLSPEKKSLKETKMKKKTRKAKAISTCAETAAKTQNVVRVNAP